MRIADALIEVLKENKSLTYKEAYKKIVERDLYQFGAKDPEAAVNAKLRCHCIGLDFPGASPVKYFKIVGKDGTRNLYALASDEDLNGESSEPSKEDVTTAQSDEDSLPEEKIDLTYLSYKSRLKREILDHILDCHPSFFEKLVVDLLLAMGYGCDDKSGQVIGKSHDGGIDGIISEDKLGLNLIYIQAKRYNEGNSVGRPEIQRFIGAMQKAEKGVFITTSKFTREALEFANAESRKHIRLIDGDSLVELMVSIA